MVVVVVVVVVGDASLVSFRYGCVATLGRVPVLAFVAKITRALTVCNTYAGTLDFWCVHVISCM